MDQLRFTIPEMLSLIGVFQCIYIIVYILFRVGDIKRVVVPVLYFVVLGLAFFTDFARAYIGDVTPYYDVIRWTAWFYGPPLSVLVILQVAQITKLPSLAEWSILLIVPAALLLSSVMVPYTSDCEVLLECDVYYDWLDITGLISGAASLLFIWMHRNLFEDLLKQKTGKERYWLILALIILNIFFLVSMSLRFGGQDFGIDTTLIRTVLGLSFIYLVTTSLFRIYPQVLTLAASKKKDDGLSKEEEAVAKKIQDLLDLDKVYHETTYSRSDMAQELGISEAAVSRIISLYFDKSFPQLLNERRIQDAQRLLLETDASIKTVSQEVGFNSLPSFNRVFKDMSGQSPSSYRKNMIK